MADLVTRLLLNNSQFDNSIRESTQLIQQFLQMGRNITSTITKFAGVLGVAVSASEIFTTAVNSNSIALNHWNDLMVTTRECVDSFFTSITTGDWSIFLDGLISTINLSHKAAQALRELRTNLKIGDVRLSDLEKELNRLENIASDESQSKETREKAFAEFKQKGKETVDYINGLSKNTNDNLTAMLAGKGIKADKNVRSLIFNYLDTSTSGGLQLLKYAKDKEELNATNKLIKDAYQMEGGAGIQLAKELEADRKKLTASVAKMEKDNPKLIQAYKLKVNFTEEEVDELLDYTDKIIGLEDRLESTKKQVTDLAKDFDSKGHLIKKDIVKLPNPKAEPNKIETLALSEGEAMYIPFKIPPKTLNDLNREKLDIINKMNNSTASEYVELKVKLNLKEQEITHFKEGGGMKIEGLNIKDAKPLTFDKSNVKTTYDYADSLNAVASAMGAISSMTNEGASAWLTWTANLMTSIATAIPAIQALTTAKTAEAGANAVASATQTPVVGWLLAGAAAASVIAAMATMPKFADGGIVSGNSTIGDMNLARVNAGEMILNNRQQRNLFNLLNNGGSAGSSAGGLVEFKISGKQLVGVLNNYNKQISRV